MSRRHTISQSLKHRVGVSTIVSAACALMLTALLGPVAVSAAPAPLRLNVTLGDYGACPVVSSAPNAPITFIWRDATGNVKKQGTQSSGESGFVGFCGPDDTGLVAWIGDRIKVSTTGYSRTFVVPDVGVRIDRAANELFGRGPALRTVRLDLQVGDVLTSKSIRVASDGTWTFVPKFDIHQLGSADLRWTSVNGDRIDVATLAPFIGVTIGKSTIQGVAYPLADVEAAANGGAAAAVEATADFSGAFKGNLIANGTKYGVEPGDHISAPAVATDADWIVPNITAQADAATDTVQGMCEDTGTAGSKVRVWVIRTGGHVRGEGFWDLESDGSFVADFGQGIPPFGDMTVNIKSHDTVRVDCIQSTGDWARLTLRVP